MGQLQITPGGYEEIKNTIKSKLNETTNNFIIIGYYMKQVRDNMLYIQDGYHNMAEFAMEEYHLSASTASRFMDINTRFSEGGNSLEIKQEYRNYGYSKLQEMLNVKDEDMELITPDTTVSQIRELKALEKKEDKAAAQEAEENMPLVMMSREEEQKIEQQEQKEMVATSQEEEYSPFEKTLLALWRAKPAELLSKVHNNMITPQELAEELCPSGSRTFNCGVYMLFLYDNNAGLKFRYYANGKPNVEAYTYADIIRITNELVTNEMFAEITKPGCAEEKLEEPEKKEWKAPQMEEKEERKEEKEKAPVLEERKAEPDEEAQSYQPLPGQTRLPELQYTESDGRAEERENEDTETQQPAAEATDETIDAEYRELDGQDKKEEQQYTQVEIQDAINYFEIEYYKMIGTGLKESEKCRNFKIAMEAIRKYYGGPTHE